MKFVFKANGKRITEDCSNIHPQNRLAVGKARAKSMGWQFLGFTAGLAA